jgi:type I restriction enzyme S subunit
MEVKPGYKLTEMSVIPEDWETRTVLSLSRQIMDYRGRTPKKLGMEWGQGEIPALSAANVKMGFIDLSQESYVCSEALYKRWMTKGRVKKDDIVFTTEAPLGNVALIPDERKYILSQRTLLLQIDPEQASSRFLFQFMLSEQFQRALADHSSGSTAKGIQRKKFEQLHLPKPPLPEQCAIADALSDVDALLGGLDCLIAKKRDLKQAAMQQLLTGQTRLPDFHAKWTTGAVRDYFDPLNMRNAELNETVVTISAQLGFVRQEEFFDKRVASASLEHYYLIQGNDFAYNRSYSNGYPFGAIKRLANFEKGVVTTLYICFRPKTGNRTNAEFFEQYFELGLLNPELATVTNEGGRAHGLLNITKADFFSRSITVPEFAEQTAIAQVLTEMDAELAELEQRWEKTRDLKQGMMQELLTGKTRLL